jgi:N-acetylmuramoyl-L-alanine amidase
LFFSWITNSVIVISIHSNAGTDGSWGDGNRWEIYKQSSEYVKKDNKRYYALHPNTSEKLAENIAKAASKIFKELGDKAPSVNGKKIKVEIKPKTFNERETDKGIRPTTFSKAPAVLSENLFHDTKEHVQFLASKEGRDAIVNLHYEGIVNFFNEMANNN